MGGETQMRQIYESYLDAILATPGLNVLFASATGRANLDHMVKMGYDGVGEVERVNKACMEWLIRFRQGILPRLEGRIFVVAGEVAPRGDGYLHEQDKAISVADAAAYHAPNVRGLRMGGAEL